uniref:BBSome complex member BBS5 PH domain-containing protein n=1 Tax=Chromera velia CCMP2878 TaxID=1169474 RepID=A0A0G4F1E0_9ALVE|eukprot:Cvel_14707.t1-p1 / transcript=Cvel_14707.t1 / gene=Cvel_14707 / organism=Chromera_velia_CCMP2878 / gene_product=Bardet-Biedl syndrome 5 protein homolog, putative / transcript_product=Bardet-Biedl syndrome 5 protein homolog, putative / location=Cvel_scaffold1056:35189-42714(-) / protein_length=464 / sequence_SO=supercontig / SO=protein_coding / is_pseudo=false
MTSKRAQARPNNSQGGAQVQRASAAAERTAWSAAPSGGFDHLVWQDKELHFDAQPSLLQLRKAEVVVEKFEAVEDTKGNAGQRGELVVTNLRLMWVFGHPGGAGVQRRRPRQAGGGGRKASSLSVGWGVVEWVSVTVAVSAAAGSVRAIQLMTGYNNSRYEFLFSASVADSPRLFSCVQSLHKAYNSSKLYREVKLRGAIMKDKSPVLLAKEEIVERRASVWNLAHDQGSVGTLIFTNVRLIWFAQLAENFNVSVPFVQMASVANRASKFGPALVVQCTQASGGYLLGFRIDPSSETDRLAKQLEKLREVYCAHPLLGVFVSGSDQTSPGQSTHKHVVDDISIVEVSRGIHLREREGQRAPREGPAETAAMPLQDQAELRGGGGVETGAAADVYAVGASVGVPAKRGRLEAGSGVGEGCGDFGGGEREGDGEEADDDRVFEPELGLAIERLPEGVTLSQLWEIL